MNATEQYCAEVCRKAGVLYQGIQPGHAQHGPLVLFARTALSTTLALPVEGFNVLAVIAKLLSVETVQEHFEKAVAILGGAR